MVKAASAFPGRMAFIAGLAVIEIPANPCVSLIGFTLVVLVTVNAAENTVIGRIGMAFGTRLPFATVLAAVYREIFSVMIESGRYPGGL